MITVPHLHLLQPGARSEPFLNLPGTVGDIVKKLTEPQVGSAAQQCLWGLRSPAEPGPPARAVLASYCGGLWGWLPGSKL